MENEEDVIVDTTTDTEETVTTDTTETDDSTTEPTVDVEALQATNKKLFERAKKAEADLKVLKGTQKPVEAQATPQLNVEETVLLAQGVSEELIAELKLRAPKYGGSLIKAQNDPLYVAVKEKFEKDEKQSKASMGAARGAGTAKVQKNFATPGLSREEHMAMVKEKA